MSKFTELSKLLYTTIHDATQRLNGSLYNALHDEILNAVNPLCFLLEQSSRDTLHSRIEESGLGDIIDVMYAMIVRTMEPLCTGADMLDVLIDSDDAYAQHLKGLLSSDHRLLVVLCLYHGKAHFNNNQSADEDV